ncbi:MAG: hypothetical protein D6730_03115, partial [Bacteroidetes bacterium]
MRLHSLKQKVVAFFHEPVSPKPLGIFRILIAAFTLLQAAFWYPDWQAFFGPEGWVQWEISQALNMGWHVHIQDVYELLAPLGMEPEAFVMYFFWVYVISATGLLLGWYTRLWAILTWFCHFVMMSSLPTFVYGVDIFLHIALFYMMLMPVAKAFSLDVRQGRVSPTSNWAVTLSLRVLQIHLCLAYFSAGYEKMLYAAWWEGNVLWRSMVQPDFRQFDMEWLAYYPWIPMLLSWGTMFIETFYFMGMYVRRLRVFWLAAMAGLHIGIGLFLG